MFSSFLYNFCSRKSSLYKRLTSHLPATLQMYAETHTGRNAGRNAKLPLRLSDLNQNWSRSTIYS